MTDPTIRAGNLFVSDGSGRGNIYQFAPDGTRSTFASGLSGGLAFDQADNLFVAAGDIYKFAPDGARSTFASGGSGALAIDPAGNLYTGDGNANIYKFSPDGTRSTLATWTIGYDNPVSLAVNGAGRLCVGDVYYYTHSGRIVEFAPDGTQSTFYEEQIAPYGLAFDSAGNLLVADPAIPTNSPSRYVPGIDEITPGGARSIFAAGFDINLPTGVVVDSAGNVFLTDSGAGKIYKFTPDGVRSTFATGLNQPTFMAFAPNTATPPLPTVRLVNNYPSQGCHP